jgi:ribosomal protein S18 acetylase RimI-like enzyme
MSKKLEFIRIDLSHLEGVLSVQEISYLPLFHENAESFVSKMKLSPSTCYGVLDEGKLIAFGISFPWFNNLSVEFNSSLEMKSTKPDIMYIHDISVAPDYRCLGLGEAIFKRILDSALEKGLNEVVLVAVQGSSTFWSRFGFTILESQVNGYGVEAVKMVLRV